MICGIALPDWIQGAGLFLCVVFTYIGVINSVSWLIVRAERHRRA